MRVKLLRKDDFDLRGFSKVVRYLDVGLFLKF